jgi:hypothetical protein
MNMADVIPKAHPTWLVVASLIASMIVGMGSAYLTANAAVARLEVKVERNEVEIQELRKDRERMVRVEAKLDVLIMDRKKD